MWGTCRPWFAMLGGRFGGRGRGLAGTLGITLDQDRIVGRQHRDRGDGGPERDEGDARDPGRERHVEQDAPLAVLEDHAPHVPFMDQLLELFHERRAVRLELFHMDVLAA